MEKEVWKFELTKGLNELRVPAGSEFLTIQQQDGRPVAWFMVDPDRAERLRVVVLGVCTGDPIYTRDRLVYRGTTQDPRGVLHFFEMPD